MYLSFANIMQAGINFRNMKNGHLGPNLRLDKEIKIKHKQLPKTIQIYDKYYQKISSDVLNLVQKDCFFFSFLTYFGI